MTKFRLTAGSPVTRRSGGAPPVPRRKLPPKEWAPNRLPTIPLPCGCTGIPWPLLHGFATDILEIHCERHGWQKITKAWLKDAKKQGYQVETELTELLEPHF